MDNEIGIYNNYYQVVPMREDSENTHKTKGLILMWRLPPLRGRSCDRRRYQPRPRDGKEETKNDGKKNAHTKKHATHTRKRRRQTIFLRPLSPLLSYDKSKRKTESKNAVLL